MIAILEKNIKTVRAMRRALETVSLEREAIFFDSAPTMISWLKKHMNSVQLISLDFHLGQQWNAPRQVVHPGTGLDVVRELSTQPPKCMVIIHTCDKRTIAEMGIELTRSGWNNFVIHRLTADWVQKKWLPKVVEELILLQYEPFLPIVNRPN